MQEQHIRGILATIVAAIVWSTAGVLVKILDQDAFTILFYRSLYAGLLFLVVFRKEALAFDKRALLISIFYAPLLISFVTSTKLTTAANAIFLQYIAPAIVLIIEPKILGTKMRRHNLITVMVCTAGLAFFLFDQNNMGHSWLGDGIALLGGFFSAGLILALRFSNRTQQVSGILLGNFWVVLVTLPWFLKSGSATGTEHLMLGYLGFIQIGIGFLLFTYGQRRIPAIESSLIAMLEPILSPLWVFLWHGEKPAIWSLIGGGVILLALAGHMIYQKNIQSDTDTPMGA